MMTFSTYFAATANNPSVANFSYFINKAIRMTVYRKTVRMGRGGREGGRESREEDGKEGKREMGKKERGRWDRRKEGDGKEGRREMGKKAGERRERRKREMGKKEGDQKGGGERNCLYHTCCQRASTPSIVRLPLTRPSRESTWKCEASDTLPLSNLHRTRRTMFDEPHTHTNEFNKG